MGYFDCVCCGTVDMSANDNETPSMCDVCEHLGCSEDSPACKILMIDGSQGIYIPKVFASRFDPDAWGVS